jgi:hypothetical protein
MPAATIKRGFEGKVYIGTAGTTASTQLVERTDITYNLSSEMADSTAAGDGSAPPLKTSEVVAVAAEISWSMLNKTEDAANINAMIDAMKAGTPMAVKVMRHASDSKAFDGDCLLDFGSAMPLSENQKFEIMANVTRRLRTPVFA